MRRKILYLVAGLTGRILRVFFAPIKFCWVRVEQRLARACVQEIRSVFATQSREFEKKLQEMRVEFQRQQTGQLSVINELLSSGPKGHRADIDLLLFKHGVIDEAGLEKRLEEILKSRDIEKLAEILDHEVIRETKTSFLYKVIVSQFLCDGQCNSENIELMYRSLPQDHFLRRKFFAVLLRQVVYEQKAQEAYDLLANLDSRELAGYNKETVKGACRLLNQSGMHTQSQQLLGRLFENLPTVAQLNYLEIAREAFGQDYKAELCHGQAVLNVLEAHYDVAAQARKKFSERVITPLRLIPNQSPQDLMDVRFSQQTRRATMDHLSDAIDQGKPFSLIRLGDGEAYVFPIPKFDDIPMSQFQHDNCIREQLWWGTQIEPGCRDDIRQKVREAIDHASLLGIPSVYRVIRDLYYPKAFGQMMVQRGLMTVLAAYGKEIAFDGKLLTEERCHQVLFDADCLVNLANRAKKVVFVGCWSADQLRLSTNKPWKHILVSAHSKVRKAAKGDDRPLHQAYPRVLEQVADASGPGTLVYVSAGLIGKMFCETARQHGAVALDIGAVSDYLAGYQTRNVGDVVGMAKSSKAA